MGDRPTGRFVRQQTGWAGIAWHLSVQAGVCLGMSVEAGGIGGGVDHTGFACWEGPGGAQMGEEGEHGWREGLRVDRTWERKESRKEMGRAVCERVSARLSDSACPCGKFAGI